MDLFGFFRHPFANRPRTVSGKIVKGASRKALEGYREILQAMLSDERLTPEERAENARRKPKVTMAEGDTVAHRQKGRRWGPLRL